MRQTNTLATNGVLCMPSDMSYVEWQSVDLPTWRKKEEEYSNKAPGSIEVLNGEECKKLDVPKVREKPILAFTRSILGSVTRNLLLLALRTPCSGNPDCTGNRFRQARNAIF